MAFTQKTVPVLPYNSDAFMQSMFIVYRELKEVRFGIFHELATGMTMHVQ